MSDGGGSGGNGERKQLLVELIQEADETAAQFVERQAFYRLARDRVGTNKALTLSLVWRNIRFRRCRYSLAVEKSIRDIDPFVDPFVKSKPRSKSPPPSFNDRCDVRDVRLRDYRDYRDRTQVRTRKRRRTHSPPPTNNYQPPPPPSIDNVSAFVDSISRRIP
jgi:hypothetical protein